MPSKPGDWEGIVLPDADPESCAAQLQARLDEPFTAMCKHIAAATGPMRWYVLLKDPGHALCERCLPVDYLLFTYGAALDRTCECCGKGRTASLTRVERRNGTALALLCVECHAQRARGVLAVAQ